MALKYKTNFTEASRGRGQGEQNGQVGGRGGLARTLCLKGWGGQKESSRGCFE